MRLISQDGMIDVPYESTNVSISYKEKNKIIAWGFGCEEHHIIDLGTYSSHEKAKNVMEILRNAYVGLPILFQNVDMNESVVEKLKEWKRDGIVLLHDNADSKIEQVNNAIFKFPTDEEVEV